jgi:hypothetical protein
MVHFLLRARNDIAITILTYLNYKLAKQSEVKWFQPQAINLLSDDAAKVFGFWRTHFVDSASQDFIGKINSL